MKMVFPECSDDFISSHLRQLTKLIDPEGMNFGIGGEYGYGANFENDTFSMNRYCWCERDKCAVCNGTRDLFYHKPSGSKINWYKYIGRDMEIDCKIPFADIFADCVNSLREAPPQACA